MSAAGDATTGLRPSDSAVAAPARPKLVFFFAKTSGPCRRVEGHLAQVLQRRANHDTFAIQFVDADEHADLVERFHVEELPTLLVVEDKSVRGRIVSPRGCREIEAFLTPWLH